MPLRFPNPGSDVDRLIHIFRLIYDGVADKSSFNLDEMSKIMTNNLQASSRGAVGSNALLRSSEIDRSRDPLYNQSKSYSEIFRMLGWLRPAGQRLQFSVTLLGISIAEDFVFSDELTVGLVKECLLGITFPNPSTNNVGITNQRPIKWLLQLMWALDGIITRHEIILGLLSVTDDLADQAFNQAVARIKNVRGNRAELINAATLQANQSGISLVTLENYTRFPVGLMKSQSIGWGVSKRVTGLYQKPCEAIQLSEAGVAQALRLSKAIDIREEDLKGFAVEERVAFAQYSYYSMLIRSGVQLSLVSKYMAEAEAKCSEVLRFFGISDQPNSFIYSPIQQASQEVLEMAEQ
jgi:hypothetical protein